MTDELSIEIWSDVICPWCGLGQRRLDKAISGFVHSAALKVVHRSFELDPSAATVPVPVRQMLQKKYRLGEIELSQMFARIEGLAKDEGLSPYIVGDNQVGNTHLAHELLAMARSLEVKGAWQHMFRAYFGDRHSIFEVDSLTVMGVQLGLDRTLVNESLLSGRFKEDVDADVSRARELGISGVPFVLLNSRLAVSGAQSVETFSHAIEKAWRER